MLWCGCAGGLKGRTASLHAVVQQLVFVSRRWVWYRQPTSVLKTPRSARHRFAGVASGSSGRAATPSAPSSMPESSSWL